MKILWNLAIVNVTSEVGGQMIECLEERKFPVGKIKFLASSRNAGEIVDFKGKPVMLEELTHDSFGGVDIALFSAGSSLSEEFSLSAVKSGAVCIDTSSAWHMDPDVPLVVPDVNPYAIQQYPGKGIVACPNSSTIQMVIALNPLHEFGRIRRIVVSTYQSVSGAGKKAIAELRTQTIDLMNARPAKNKIFPHRIAFNCLSHTDSFCPDGYTMEEKQIAEETCKIMDADIRTTATTVAANYLK
jgi:aspartate-semialdehyde dehydrogenase